VNFEPHFLKTLNNRYSHVFTWIDTYNTVVTDIPPSLRLNCNPNRWLCQYFAIGSTALAIIHLTTQAT